MTLPDSRVRERDVVAVALELASLRGFGVSNRLDQGAIVTNSIAIIELQTVQEAVEA